MPRLIVAAILLTLLPASAFAQREYGFDNRKPSGQPYLSPDESVRRMKVADGFEVKLFAAEPMVVNPVAMFLASAPTPRPRWGCAAALFVSFLVATLGLWLAFRPTAVGPKADFDWPVSPRPRP